MSLDPKYARLRNTIFAATLCFALLPLLLVGIIIPTQFTGLYNDKTLREVENVAKAKSRTIDMFFEERIAQLRILATMNSFEELTKAGKLQDVLRTLKNASPSYVDLGVIDMDGNHAAYAGAYDVRTANYKNELWFSETKRKGIFISDVFLGFRHFPHIIIAVLREDGDKAWILRATIDSAVFTSVVQSSHLSAEGDAFVVSRNGELQTDSYLAGQTMSKVPVEWPRSGSSVSEEQLRGRNMLLAKVPLTQVPWLLVVAEDPAQEFSLLFQTRSLAAMLILFGVTALGLGTWLVTRMIVNRLMGADREKASYDSSLLQSSKMASLGKMAAGVAHEINNPLMLIRENAGWIRDLLEDESVDTMQHHADVQKAALKVEQHVDRARDITHRLLGFARRMDPSSESLPVNPIVDQAIAFLAGEATFRGITINRDFTQDELRVSTDVGRLQQVILNVIDNAIDALGGAVEKGLGHVVVKTEKRGDTAVITIRDNGPGIPPDKIGSIFDPFFTTKAPGEGTGLGLSICWSIMESLGGTIAAENPADGGAMFTITLPTGA
jgi:two-component system NtrC family sensor kinase